MGADELTEGKLDVTGPQCTFFSSSCINMFVGSEVKYTLLLPYALLSHRLPGL